MKYTSRPTTDISKPCTIEIQTYDINTVLHMFTPKLSNGADRHDSGDVHMCPIRNMYILYQTLRTYK